MLSVAENKRSQLRPHVSLLDKSPQPNVATERTRTILPAYRSQEDHFISPGFQTYRLMKKQILELEVDPLKVMYLLLFTHVLTSVGKCIS